MLSALKREEACGQLQQRSPLREQAAQSAARRARPENKGSRKYKHISSDPALACRALNNTWPLPLPGAVANVPCW